MRVCVIIPALRDPDPWTFLSVPTLEALEAAYPGCTVLDALPYHGHHFNRSLQLADPHPLPPEVVAELEALGFAEITPTFASD